MNKSCILIFSFLFFKICDGQNIVPNPGFESYVACPHSFAQFNNFVSDWTAWKSNPDYFNACDTGITASVPNNCSGYQQANTGSGYAGIHAYSGSTINPSYREYIGVQLISPLIVGTTYFASMKISATFLDTNCTTDIKYVSNKLGFLFSTVSYSLTNPFSVPNFAHISENAIISDTANWTLVKGAFIADSAYQYLAIGNFFDDTLTSTFMMNPSGYSPMSYYYIDDVCVSTDSVTCNSTLGIKDLKSEVELILFPNPFKDKINITVGISEVSEVSLFDLTGRKILNQSFVNSISINTDQLDNGIYIYELRNKKRVMKKGKIVKE